MPKNLEEAAVEAVSPLAGTFHEQKYVENENLLEFDENSFDLEQFDDADTAILNLEGLTGQNDVIEELEGSLEDEEDNEIISLSEKEECEGDDFIEEEAERNKGIDNSLQECGRNCSLPKQFTKVPSSSCMGQKSEYRRYADVTEDSAEEYGGDLDDEDCDRTILRGNLSNSKKSGMIANRMVRSKVINKIEVENMNRTKIKKNLKATVTTKEEENEIDISKVKKCNAEKALIEHKNFYLGKDKERNENTINDRKREIRLLSSLFEHIKPSRKPTIFMDYPESLSITRDVKRNQSIQILSKSSRFPGKFVAVSKEKEKVEQFNEKHDTQNVKATKMESQNGKGKRRTKHYEEEEHEYTFRLYWERTVVKDAFLCNGFKRVKGSKWSTIWAKHPTVEGFAKILPYQKVNHFPGSWCIGRKDRLLRSINRMKRKATNSTSASANFTAANTVQNSRNSTQLTNENHIHNKNKNLKHKEERKKDQLISIYKFPTRKVSFSFHPESYCLPYDIRTFHALVNNPMNDKTLWIVKPNASSCGRGIKVINRDDALNLPEEKKCIVQRYISNPYLIDGRKFDLRLYVLVTSVDPLKIYLYQEGLVRFSSHPYSNKNISSRFAHLTNYSVQKKSKLYTHNQDAATDNEGCKWSLSAFWRYLEEKEGEKEKKDLSMDKLEQTKDIQSSKSKKTRSGFNVSEPNKINKLITEIRNIIVKTLIAGEEDMVTNERRQVKHRNCCYELFGFDILLDTNLKPWLLEVNVSPSLNGSSPLDRKIKGSLMVDIFHLVGIYPYNYNLKFVNTDRKGNSIGKNIQNVNNKRVNKLLRNRQQDQFRLSGRPESIDMSKLQEEDWDLIMDMEDEYNRRGHFIRLFPTKNDKLANYYLSLFISQRFSNALLCRWCMDNKNAEDVEVYMKNPSLYYSTSLSRSPSPTKRGSLSGKSVNLFSASKETLSKRQIEPYSKSRGKEESEISRGSKNPLRPLEPDATLRQEEIYEAKPNLQSCRNISSSQDKINFSKSTPDKSVVEEATEGTLIDSKDSIGPVDKHKKYSSRNSSNSTTWRPLKSSTITANLSSASSSPLLRAEIRAQRMYQQQLADIELSRTIERKKQRMGDAKANNMNGEDEKDTEKNKAMISSLSYSQMNDEKCYSSDVRASDCKYSDSVVSVQQSIRTFEHDRRKSEGDKGTVARSDNILEFVDRSALHKQISTEEKVSPRESMINEICEYSKDKIKGTASLISSLTIDSTMEKLSKKKSDKMKSNRQDRFHREMETNDFYRNGNMEIAGDEDPLSGSFNLPPIKRGPQDINVKSDQNNIQQQKSNQHHDYQSSVSTGGNATRMGTENIGNLKYKYGGMESLDNDPAIDVKGDTSSYEKASKPIVTTFAEEDQTLGSFQKFSGARSWEVDESIRNQAPQTPRQPSPPPVFLIPRQKKGQFLNNKITTASSPLRSSPMKVGIRSSQGT